MDCECRKKKIIKVWTITPGMGCNPCTERDPKAIFSWIEGAEPGDVIKIVVSEIDEAIYNEMPEYMGP